MTASFAGKVALVTGAGSGIGRATALAFAAAGAQIAVVDVDAGGGDATVGLISDSGGQAEFLQCDVSVEAEVAGLIEQTLSRFGGLDCAHNNAGIDGNVTRPLADQTVEDWNRVIAVNLTGVFLCMKYELPAMISRGGGAIVNTSSIAGIRGYGGSSPYGASKHGVVGLTRIAALDYAGAGIRVNAVCPGGVETAMLEANPRIAEALAMLTPLKRLGQPNEIADLVVWLCSPEAAYVTGQSIAADGGFTI